MTTLIIRFAYACLIMTFYFMVMGVLYTPWWFAGSTITAYTAGLLKREAFILAHGKWYDGKDLI